MTNEARGDAANEGLDAATGAEFDDRTNVSKYVEDREIDDRTIVSVQASVEDELDHTVVSVQASASEDSDHTVVSVQPPVGDVSDHTVVSAQLPVGDDSDHTVVSVQPPVSDISDHTVVVNQADAVRAVDSGENLDYTVVANHPQELRGPAETTGDPLPVAEGTMVVPQRRRARREAVHIASAASVPGVDPAPPIAEPKARRSLRRIVGGGLDPNRPIAEAPGSLPWEVQAAGVRGVAQGLPVSYGTRVNTDMPVEQGIDLVQRVVGPAPAARPVAIAPGREQLPSLTKRDRRRRGVTLAVYAAVTVACVFGLWGVASIAFGW